MRKIREVLRLKFEHKLSHRAISTTVGISKGSVAQYLKRAKEAEMSWERARGLDDAEVERRLFKDIGRNEPRKRAPIDFNWVHSELRKTGVTLQLLWLEYREEMATLSSRLTAYQYSQFCDLYAIFRKKVDVSMRQVHRAGEKMFIDYSGKKPEIYDRDTGECVAVELFVAVLGASNYTFAEATRTQRSADFCASTIRAFEYFDGVPQIVVPDQLRSAVKGPDRYDPEINPTYADLAEHYGTAIIPARPRRPKDKAKVENAVLVVQRWILACLRTRKFFSLDELNVAIAELLGKLNARPFKKLTDEYDSITVPDYLESRFSRDGGATSTTRLIRIFGAAALAVFVTIYVSAQIDATGKAFTAFLGWNHYTGALVGFGIVVVYTLFGGFVAVSWSDLFQGSLKLW